MPIFQIFKNPRFRLAMTAFVILGAAVFLIHQNRLVIMERLCLGDIQELRKVLEVAQPLPKHLAKSNYNPTKLEFPRLFTVPDCNPEVNKTVPREICKYLGSKMDESERQTYLRLLKLFDKYAKKHKWTYFLFLNSLLGSWRHHDLAPYRPEVDLYVDHKHRLMLPDIIEGGGTRFRPKQMVHDKIRFYDRDHVVGGAYYDDIGRWYTPSLNIIFYRENKTHIWRSDYPDQYVMRKSDVFPLHERPLGPLMLPAPKDTLKHLVENFGATEECKRITRLNTKTQCREFKAYFPFVQRAWKNGKMEETLLLDGKKIQVKNVDEMIDNMPLNPYTLASTKYPEKRTLFFF